MPKPGKAAESHRQKHLVDMSPAAPTPEEPTWQRPPDDECEEPPPFTTTPPMGDPTRDRLKVRLVSHVQTDRLVEFAIVQQAYYRGKWRDVAEIDSVHDDNVHLHQYSKRSGERTGEREVLMVLRSLDDVQLGYEIGLQRVMDEWQTRRARWDSG